MNNHMKRFLEGLKFSLIVISLGVFLMLCLYTVAQYSVIGFMIMFLTISYPLGMQLERDGLMGYKE